MTETVRLSGFDAVRTPTRGGPGVRGALRAGGDAGAAAGHAAVGGGGGEGGGGVAAAGARRLLAAVAARVPDHPAAALDRGQRHLRAGGACRRASCARRSRSRRCGSATARFGAAEYAVLDGLIAAQAAAVAAEDREAFHALDDEFHRRICALVGSRVRLDADPREEGAHGPGAVPEPELRRRAGARRPPGDPGGDAGGDAEAAVAAMRTHLGRIEDILARIRVTHGEHFGSEG